MSGWERWAPLTGIGFVVLFVVGFMLGLGTPDDTAPDRDWTAWYADRGHQAMTVVGAFLIVLAAICLLSFVATLRGRIAAARPDQQAGSLPLLLTSMGAAGIAAGGVINASVGGAAIFGHLPHLPSADVLRLIGNLSFPMMMVAGLVPVAFAVAALALEARSAGLFGVKMQVFTFVGALGAIAAFMFMPTVLLLLWVITASIVLLRSGASGEPVGAGSTATAVPARS